MARERVNVLLPPEVAARLRAHSVVTGESLSSVVASGLAHLNASLPAEIAQRVEVVRGAITGQVAAEAKDKDEEAP